MLNLLKHSQCKCDSKTIFAEPEDRNTFMHYVNAYEIIEAMGTFTAANTQSKPGIGSMPSLNKELTCGE